MRHSKRLAKTYRYRRRSIRVVMPSGSTIYSLSACLPMTTTNDEDVGDVDIDALGSHGSTIVGLAIQVNV